MHDLSTFLSSMLFSGLIISFCQVAFISACRLTKNTGILSILALLNGIPAYAISIFRYG